MSAGLCEPVVHERQRYVPSVPRWLASGEFAVQLDGATEPPPSGSPPEHAELVRAAFPTLYGGRKVVLLPHADAKVRHEPLRVGCVLSGAPAAGAHNCVCGVFDFLAAHAPGSTLLGFVGGLSALARNQVKELDARTIDSFRNTGGFTMLSSGDDSMTPQQLSLATQIAKARHLDGLIVIGGDAACTTATYLAECFLSAGLGTRVVALPKSMKGELKSEDCEMSFGFDTASKLYCELVGNIMTDCESSRKYYHFIRLMGRLSSHLTLEVALQTMPTLAFIGEEVFSTGTTLHEIVIQIVETVAARSAAGLDYGVILMPEGLLTFIQEVNVLITEVNQLLDHLLDDDSNCYSGVTVDSIDAHLSSNSSSLLSYLPDEIQHSLVMDRDGSGHVQVDKIEVERLVGKLVEKEIAKRRRQGSYQGVFASQCHYFGFEGRCPPPSNFDCNLCYGLGLAGAALVGAGCTGLMASIQHLTKDPGDWGAVATPLTHIMRTEKRNGTDVPFIQKTLVDLSGRPFAAFQAQRACWTTAATFCQPGPIQFDGDSAGCVTLTLQHEQLAVPPVASNDPPLFAQRRRYTPQLPRVFAPGSAICAVEGVVTHSRSDELFVSQRLPATYGLRRLHLRSTTAGSGIDVPPNLTIGVVFCGRQCPGAHNVVAGLHHFLEQRAGKGARLVGFLNGTRGLCSCDAREITREDVATYVNTGGMQLLGRTADVLRGAEQLAQVEAACAKLGLHGLVLIGGSVSNSDTAMLADHFAAQQLPTRIIGVPASIDGDLYDCEACIGNDTACRVYASLVGNLATDAASVRKHWYFVRIMGRSPSHIALECASLTQPNITLIGEEIEAKRMSLAAIVSELADIVTYRASEGKRFGVVLIPEGLIEYIPEVNALMREIMMARTQRASNKAAILALLTPWSAALLNSMPPFIQHQLLLDPQASDHKAQLSQIETERLLADLVRLELDRRRKLAQLEAEWCAPDTKFSAVCFYLGYQARSSMPSNFDCDLGYTLGCTAAALVASGVTAYMATAHCLTSSPADWRVCGTPLASFLSAESRSGMAVPAIRPSGVDLHSDSFKSFAAHRDEHKMMDAYRNPGPLQFMGSFASRLKAAEIAEKRSADLMEVAEICKEVEAVCWPGCKESVIKTTLGSLRALQANLNILQERDASEQSAPLAQHSWVTQLTPLQLSVRDN